MPKKKTINLPESGQTVQETPIVKQTEVNPNVKIVELNGRKYNEIFDPLEGTTRMELLVE